MRVSQHAVRQDAKYTRHSPSFQKTLLSAASSFTSELIRAAGRTLCAAIGSCQTVCGFLCFTYQEFFAHTAIDMIPRQRFFKRNRATGIKIRVKSRIGERLYPRVIAEKLIPAVKALTGFHSSIYRLLQALLQYVRYGHRGSYK